MKNTLLFLLAGIILGASAYHFHLRDRPAATPAATLTERTRLAAADAEAAVTTPTCRLETDSRRTPVRT